MPEPKPLFSTTLKHEDLAFRARRTIRRLGDPDRRHIAGALSQLVKRRISLAGLGAGVADPAQDTGTRGNGVAAGAATWTAQRWRLPNPPLRQSANLLSHRSRQRLRPLRLPLVGTLCDNIGYRQKEPSHIPEYLNALLSHTRPCPCCPVDGSGRTD